MKTYSGPSHGSGPISLSIIQDRIRKASMSPLINLEHALEGSGNSNPTYYKNRAPIQDPNAVQEYAKDMSLGPDYPRIIEQWAKGLKEVPGEQFNVAYSMEIPLAEGRRAILTSTGTIDDRVLEDKKLGTKGRMYKQYVFAYDGRLYVMPSQVRKEASEYFERMREASSKIRPDLNEKLRKETYQASVRDLGNKFEITHLGNLTGIRYTVIVPKLPYRKKVDRHAVTFQSPQSQLDKAA